mgnify:CR=1 FL=1
MWRNSKSFLVVNIGAICAQTGIQAKFSTNYVKPLGRPEGASSIRHANLSEILSKLFEPHQACLHVKLQLVI